MKLGFAESDSSDGSKDPAHPQSARKSFFWVKIGSIAMGAIGFSVSCAKKETAASTAVTAVAKHEHHAPHGGTPVVLGDEAYHLELVRDATNGKLQAFVLDGEMENFVRCAATSFEMTAMVDGSSRVLTFQAIADSATGEKIGDTALFETSADWLKTTARFDGILISLTVRGTAFEGVKFNFPQGNDHD
jgi:hypothetical protein